MPFLTSSLQLTSPAFADNGLIPLKYTFRGENVSPPLQITDMPYGTRSMVLMMHAPNTTSGDWLHWCLYNISREVTEIAENSVPTGALQGVISTGRIGYSGPNPPAGSGVRQYFFELYALTIVMELENGADRMTIEQLLGEGHIMAKARLTGLIDSGGAQPVATASAQL